MISGPPNARAVGIILAAGGSTRMGHPKALLDLRGQPLIRHHVDALAARCERVIVVVGAHASSIREVLPGTVSVIVNADWSSTGLGESLALALAPLGPGQALVTPVDVPPAPGHVLDALLARGAPAVPTWQGRPGHPVLVAIAPTRRGLRGGTLRSVLSQAPRVAVSWPDTLLNLNTPEQWERWQNG